MRASLIGIYLFVLIALCTGAYFSGQIRREILPEITLPRIVPSTNKIPQEIVLPDISLHQIFERDHKWTATLSAEKIRIVIATGDVIPARSVNNTAVIKNSFIWPFEKTASLLKSADLTLVNLESPLLATCSATTSGMSFCADARHIEGLKYSGVDIAGLANNHLGNYGKIGIDETMLHLTNAGISYTGTDAQPIIKDVRGMRFAFLSYNDIGHKEEGIAWADEAVIVRDIKAVKTAGAIAIVSYHWGTEYQRLPDLRQRELAHLSIDAGADMIIGNHPHWIEPVEIYKGKLIMYAHGNFIFDQEWSEETKIGVVGKYIFYDKKLIDVEYIPIRIIDYGQPYILESAATQSVLDSLRDSSQELLDLSE